MARRRGRTKPSSLMNTGNRQFYQSAYRNDNIFQMYYNRLLELSISMFEWVNLPDTIDPRFLELILFGDGYAAFFKDEEIGYLGLRCMIGGRLNVYQIPMDRTAYASNGYNKPLSEDNSVLIFNNMIHTNSVLEIENFSVRLAEIDRIIDVNVRAQKTPILISCDESQRLTMKNVYMQYEGNVPFIFGDSNLNPNALKVLKTDAPYLAGELYTLKTQCWNEALTYLGISNVNIQKRERLITDEVTRNQGGTIASRYSRLESRRQACDQINKMFGLDIWCNYREDFQNPDIDEMLGVDTLEEKDERVVIENE